MTGGFGEFVSEYGLYLGYALVIIAVLSVIILPLINSINDPKSLLKGGLGILFLGVVYLISYLLAGNEVLPTYLEYGVDASASKLIGGALISMYILIGIALVFIVYTEISKLTK
jgi:hypothetical protein